MATITTKYSVGDVVWHAGTFITQKKHDCPDCLGAREWKAVSPAGGEYSFSCPRCSVSFVSNNGLSLKYSAFEPLVRRMTIGSVRVDTHSDKPIEYMCEETGIGSGSIWYERDLFSSEDEAMKAAEVKARLANTETEWIVKQYDQSLSLSDYQLSNALIESARKKDISRSVDLEILFQDLRDAEGVDEVKRIMDEFKFTD